MTDPTPAHQVQPAATRVRDPISGRSIWLAGMVKNITDKIHTKISDSGVKEEDLVKEAESIMSNLKNLTKNNPLMSNLSEMFKNMPQANGAGGGMPKNARPQVDTNKVRLHSTRERLRRKLEKKRQALQKIQKGQTNE